MSQSQRQYKYFLCTARNRSQIKKVFAISPSRAPATLTTQELTEVGLNLSKRQPCFIVFKLFNPIQFSLLTEPGKDLKGWSLSDWTRGDEIRNPKKKRKNSETAWRLKTQQRHGRTRSQHEVPECEKQTRLVPGRQGRGRNIVVVAPPPHA